MRRNNSEIPQPQTLVADTRAPIATWTGPWTCEVWFQSAGRKNFHVIRVHTHREKVYLGLCENPGVWGANPASKEKVSAASSVVISPNYQCTMDTLSLSMKLQQQPEADADALLRFPADSES